MTSLPKRADWVRLAVWILLLAALVLLAVGGVVPGRGAVYTPAIIPTTTDPTGVCANGQARVQTVSQAFFYCAGAQWVRFLPATGGLPAWAQIATHDTTGAAEATFTFSGLAGDTDQEYLLTAYVVSDGTAKVLFIQPNADATTANYSYQEFYGNNGTPTASGVVANYTGIEFLGSSATAAHVSSAVTHLYAKSGANRAWATNWGRMDSAVGALLSMQTTGEWLNTAAPIASLKVLTSDGSAHIGIGSHFALWAPRTPTGPTGSVVLTPTVQTVTASGTYTTPANAHALKVSCVGGAGGGGGGAGSGAGAGGGEGGVSIGVFNPPAASYPVTIGAGGTAGSAVPGAGGDGGQTTFGPLVANGGHGGGPQGQPAGLGGTASGGSLNIQGNAGGSGSQSGNTYGGAGAPGPWGGSGLGGAPANASGSAGTGYGAGGGGGAAGNPDGGGAGYQGACVVEIY